MLMLSYVAQQTPALGNAEFDVFRASFCLLYFSLAQIQGLFWFFGLYKSFMFSKDAIDYRLKEAAKI